MTQGSSNSPSISPIEISFPFPKALYTTLHLHLTFLDTTAMVFLTTTAMGESHGAATRPMGSFVYAMPDRSDHKATMSTSLYISPGTIDYARRTAQALARRMHMMVYVGCSVELAGQVAEEEIEGLVKVVDAIVAKWEAVKGRQRNGQA
ncbi:hypothetical protein PRK78_000208 [Emydomyces testavorans]|uniref:Uncharacterized protein n=1 Tax=Emydomyces testavorans TaxID=2070801 RepID=A0AAF0DAP7_9EURO|nr:hypothetical protein PRK78_000208 [Emydomyces testavorans]